MKNRSRSTGISTSILLLTVLLFTSFDTENHPNKIATPYVLKTVVIDAGHGGHDHGCSGSSNKEKTVALNLALKLGALIEKNYPDVKVVYTRKTDVFVELYERAAIANRNNADLFICIHCNANPSSSPSGTETYVMGLHKTEANLNVAKRENDVILMEDDYSQHYDGFDPNNPASHIIFSLNQHAFMEQSILFASSVEKYFKTNSNRSSRGVKQAGFLVLWKTAMPSVLIETGFLTNTSEEKFLGSDAGQNSIAESIFYAFRDYKNDMENNSGKVSDEKIAKIETEMKKESEAEIIATNNSNSVENNKGIEFRVQFYASATEEKMSKFAALKPENITYVKESGMYKYRLGPYSNIEEATKKQTTARNAGYKDAFVIAFKDGKRISVEEAKAFAGK
ncbi:MAG: N-acetylmuramoyl-L-alanine amidase [Bacteroidetes bacterium]|nr:N-acetylmuramoyl-L-alanine amidase [Bacteroidota bacterium]MBP9796526.1 N-acetylmuramoyl-L-alanine amidase [Chitinophagales bacterium]